jgi:hypothetical protein
LGLTVDVDVLSYHASGFFSPLVMYHRFAVRNCMLRGSFIIADTALRPDRAADI